MGDIDSKVQEKLNTPKGVALLEKIAQQHPVRVEQTRLRWKPAKGGSAGPHAYVVAVDKNDELELRVKREKNVEETINIKFLDDPNVWFTSSHDNVKRKYYLKRHTK